MGRGSLQATGFGAEPPPPAFSLVREGDIPDNHHLFPTVNEVPMTIITARGLTKRYGRRTGIEEVALDVPEGALFGFLGPNGAGKTTTIRLLLGFLRPSGGTARILGFDCWRESSRVKAHTGYLPGDLRLYPWMTGRSAIGIAGRVHKRDLRHAGGALAERYRFDMLVPVHKMSRGTRQKLGIILALVHRPRLIVLDEPTTALDPLVRDELAAHLRELAREGATVFFSSHTLSEVEDLCSEIAIVREGRVVASERLDVLRGRARRRVDLVQDPACPLEPPPFLAVIEQAGDRWHCELEGDTRELIAWAATASLRDLSIGPPDLETLFRRYYRREESR